jgi:hypothetical protein
VGFSEYGGWRQGGCNYKINRKFGKKFIAFQAFAKCFERVDNENRD